MEIIPIATPILKEKDDLSSILVQNAQMEDGDIIAISSKAVATVEDAAIDLSALDISDEAIAWSEKLENKPKPAFCQAVLDETKRLNGRVLEGCPSVMLTELKPDGLKEGTILCANAGLDQSNVEEGYAIGWSLDPLQSLKELRRSILGASGKRIALLMTDSICVPRRLGVTAIALTVCGFDPFYSHIGKRDLFDHEMTMTQEARADQLATAANYVMGNADESIPAAIIRDHGIAMTDFEGWVEGIEASEDLFCV